MGFQRSEPGHGCAWPVVPTPTPLPRVNYAQVPRQDAQRTSGRGPRDGVGARSLDGPGDDRVEAAPHVVMAKQTETDRGRVAHRRVGVVEVQA